MRLAVGWGALVSDMKNIVLKGIICRHVTFWELFLTNEILHLLHASPVPSRLIHTEKLGRSFTQALVSEE